MVQLDELVVSLEIESNSDLSDLKDTLDDLLDTGGNIDVEFDPAFMNKLNDIEVAIQTKILPNFSTMESAQSEANTLQGMIDQRTEDIKKNLSTLGLEKLRETFGMKASATEEDVEARIEGFIRNMKEFLGDIRDDFVRKRKAKRGVREIGEFMRGIVGERQLEELGGAGGEIMTKLIDVIKTLPESNLQRQILEVFKKYAEDATGRELGFARLKQTAEDFGKLEKITDILDDLDDDDLKDLVDMFKKETHPTKKLFEELGEDLPRAIMEETEDVQREESKNLMLAFYRAFLETVKEKGKMSDQELEKWALPTETRHWIANQIDVLEEEIAGHGGTFTKIDNMLVRITDDLIEDIKNIDEEVAKLLQDRKFLFIEAKEHLQSGDMKELKHGLRILGEIVTMYKTISPSARRSLDTLEGVLEVNASVIRSLAEQHNILRDIATDEQREEFAKALSDREQQRNITQLKELLKYIKETTKPENLKNVAEELNISVKKLKEITSNIETSGGSPGRTNPSREESGL